MKALIQLSAEMKNDRIGNLGQRLALIDQNPVISCHCEQELPLILKSQVYSTRFSRMVKFCDFKRLCGRLTPFLERGVKKELPHINFIYFFCYLFNFCSHCQLYLVYFKIFFSSHMVELTINIC